MPHVGGRRGSGIRRRNRERSERAMGECRHRQRATIAILLHEKRLGVALPRMHPTRLCARWAGARAEGYLYLLGFPDIFYGIFSVIPCRIY